MRKDKKLDIERLTAWLGSLTKEDFDADKNDNLINGVHVTDMEHYYEEEDLEKIKGSQIIFTKEPFLVDLYNSQLCIGIYSKKQVKTPTGRKTHIKLLNTLLDIQKTYGVNRNGYWKIPQSFYK